MSSTLARKIAEAPPVLFQPRKQAPKPMQNPLRVASSYEPAGDQPTAIRELVRGVEGQEQDQVLLGVTGSGKTFTMAKVIEAAQRPALILAPNKTLAAQLYAEMKGFFPDNAVEYFVSYYDYYQPEAYVPRTDTYIEKDSQINEAIERMRHSATRALLERGDVVIVSSVSCIYGIGSVETYGRMIVKLEAGGQIDRDQLARALVELQYRRNDANFIRGTFRLRGETVDVFPSHLEDRAWRISLFGDEIEAIREFDPLTGEVTGTMDAVNIYANSHYVTPRPTLTQAIADIKVELQHRLKEFTAEGKLLEAERLQQRTTFDIEMIETTGACKSIENYSRYLSGRKPGEPPPTLFEYLPENAMLIVDESHVTVPQIGGMSRGDAARKSILSEFGFRLPSCMDNRPLRFEEWEQFRPQTVFVSATPGPWEMERTGGTFAEQVIRPTGLIDPVTEVRPVERQVDDLLGECRTVISGGGRILVTTLTKRMSEDLTEYLTENGVKVRYLHSGRGHVGAHRDHPRPAAGRVRRAGGHQPVARRPRHPGMRPGRHPRRRQGRVPALPDQPDPDHRPRRPQRGRARGPVCRRDDPQPPRRHRGNGAPPGQAGSLERGPRHHPHQRPLPYRRGAAIRVRAGLRDGRPGQGRRRDGHGREGPEVLPGRAGAPDARRRRRPGVRDGGSAARRDQAAGSPGPRPETPARPRRPRPQEGPHAGAARTRRWRLRPGQAQGGRRAATAGAVAVSRRRWFHSPYAPVS